MNIIQFLAVSSACKVQQIHFGSQNEGSYVEFLADIPIRGLVYRSMSEICFEVIGHELYRSARDLVS